MSLETKMMNQKTTEQSSNYEDLEKMSTSELLQNMNAEDKKSSKCDRENYSED